MRDVAQADERWHAATTNVRGFCELSLDMLEDVAHGTALVMLGRVKRGRRGGIVREVPRWSQNTAEAAGLSRCKPVTREFADARWRALRRLLVWAGIPFEEGYADRCARPAAACLCADA